MAGEEATGHFTAHRGRVTAVAQLPATQGADLLVTAGEVALAPIRPVPTGAGSSAALGRHFVC